jgi:hypothetical protein
MLATLLFRQNLDKSFSIVLTLSLSSLFRPLRENPVVGWPQRRTISNASGHSTLVKGMPAFVNHFNISSLKVRDEYWFLELPLDVYLSIEAGAFLYRSQFLWNLWKCFQITCPEPSGVAKFMPHSCPLSVVEKGQTTSSSFFGRSTTFHTSFDDIS